MVWIIAAIAVITVFIALSSLIEPKNHFKYPYLEVDVDITGKRQPHVDDLIDQWLIDTGNSVVLEHKEKVDLWKSDCLEKIRYNPRRYRVEHLEQATDDNNAFRVSLYRLQTRYRQKNYRKEAYKVRQLQQVYTCSLNDILERYERLRQIDFQCTLREWEIKNQRKLMTTELKNRIKERDSYTCQICGKYMPDCVGLHIDHIIPVSKGGKSVESNLRVLCSVCNLRKSDNLEEVGK